MKQIDTQKMKQVRGGVFWLIPLVGLIGAGARAGANASGHGAGNAVGGSRC